MKYSALLCCLVILAVQGCITKASEQKAETVIPELPVVQANAKDTSLTKHYVADIEAIQNVEIRSKLSGFLEKIFVDEGKPVQKGQPLFKINDQQLQIELAKARANVQSTLAEATATELELKRVQVLADKKIISSTETELANARLKAAQAKVNEAKTMQADVELRLSYSLIRSPFNGILDRIPFKLGSLINDGALLTTVSDLSAVYAYFNVSENEYLQYFKARLKKEESPQDKLVSLILADGSLYNQQGQIETMEGEFDESTGSIAFRAKFANPDKLLKHGSTGKISIATAVNNAILIPQKAVFDIQDKNYVFVADSTGSVHMKSVVFKTRIDQFYLVESGILPGENIVYEGIQNIKDGMRIKPRMVSMNSLLAK